MSMDLSALLPERMVIEAREGRRLRKALSSVSETAFATAVQTLAAGVGAGVGRASFRTQGAIAILDVRGILSKEFSLWGLIFGGQACTEHVLAMLNAAVADPEVKRVLAVFDTPGGDVRGIDELAEALYLARKVKPIIGFGSDRCMSGGMWLASQCEKLYLSANCWTGSIGVRISIEDDERAELNAGIDRREFGSTPAKLNAPDTALQQATDDLAANFVTVVARGRGISLVDAQELADALPYIGQRAVDRGLADGVTTLQALVGQLQEEIAAAPPVTVEIYPHNEEDETETTRAEAPAIEPRAEGEGHLEAQQEDTMAEITQAQLDKALADVSAKFETKVTALSTDVAALAKENTELKAKVAGVSENVVSMTAEKDLVALIEKARTDVKVTVGNEAYMVPAICAAAGKSMDAARALVESLPKLGKGEGSVLGKGAGAGAGAPPPRHRFDVMGPEACAASTEPRVQKYAEKIAWIAAQEKATGREFKTAAAAFAAYDSAHAGQAA